MRALGIDIGGSGMKGAVVDTATGKFVTDRYRLPTPRKATPDAMATVAAKIVEHFKWKGRVGIVMPGPIKSGRVMTANNIDKSWIGVEANKLYGKACGRKVTVLNDADAAGVAEMRFGAGRNQSGVVMIITLGTGIGSALFLDGALVPNTELGQIELNGSNAEEVAAARVRKEKDWSWKKWARYVSMYVSAVEHLVWPDLIIIGGGVSKKANKFIPRIKTRAKVVPAKLRNDAGIVGAALSAMVN